jgi:autotransporter-associated beta strand protein
MTLSGVISQSLSGVISISKTGSGSVTLSGNNAFTGTVSATAGTLNANSTTAFGADTSTGAVSGFGAISLGAALNYGTRSWTISGGLTTTPKIVLAYTGVGSVRIGPIVFANDAYIRATETGTFASPINNSGQRPTVGAASGKTLTLTGGISGTGGLLVGLFGDASGVVSLTTANTYQGTTTLGYGTLSVGNDNALGTGSLSLPTTTGSLDASTATVLSNTITSMAAKDLTFIGTANLTLASALSWGFPVVDTRTITVNGNVLTLSGQITAQNHNFDKQGPAILRLGGNNAATLSASNWRVFVGTLQLSNINGCGSTGVILSAGTVFQTMTTGGQNGKATINSLLNTSGGTIKIGG